MDDEAKEFEVQLEPWVVEKLDEILGFTAPEMRRLKLLKLLVDASSTQSSIG